MRRSHPRLVPRHSSRYGERMRLIVPASCATDPGPGVPCQDTIAYDAAPWWISLLIVAVGLVIVASVWILASRDRRLRRREPR